MAKNDNLHKAKDAKNDEFYTRIEDVAEELRHYKKHFAGKVVLCNCDDPTWSAFWRYFHLNFAEFGLKKLISTHYDRTEPTYKMEYEGGDDNNVEIGVKTPLEDNGDFRNKECLDLLDECDIVVTNPPFSLARNYVQCLREHNKQFVIIGDLNWITYKEIFPMLKDNEVWLGYSSVKKFVQPDGTIKKFGNKLWYTNLDIQKRHTIFSLPLSFTKYTLTETKLIIQRGCFNLREDEIQLYRVRDIAFKQNFYERLCRVGSIHLCSTDAMTPEIDIRRIKNPRDVKEVLSKTIEACRKANGIRTSEIIGDHGRFPEPNLHGMPPEPCHEHPHD